MCGPKHNLFMDVKKNVVFLSTQRETDLVRIKTKMIDDQTETVRNLKEVRAWHCGNYGAFHLAKFSDW